MNDSEVPKSFKKGGITLEIVRSHRDNEDGFSLELPRVGGRIHVHFFSLVDQGGKEEDEKLRESLAKIRITDGKDQDEVIAWLRERIKLFQNFTCAGCGGELVAVGELDDGRKIYNCADCSKNTVFECITCHRPRNVDGVGRCLHCTMQLISPADIVQDKERVVQKGYLERTFEGREITATVDEVLVKARAWRIRVYIEGFRKKGCTFELIDPDIDRRELLNKAFEANVVGTIYKGVLTMMIIHENVIGGEIAFIQDVEK